PALIVSFGALAVPGLASLPRSETNTAFRVSITCVVLPVFPFQSVWVTCTVYRPVASAAGPVADQPAPDTVPAKVCVGATFVQLLQGKTRTVTVGLSPNAVPMRPV